MKLREGLNRLRGEGLTAHLVQGAAGTATLGFASKLLSLAAAVLLGRALGVEAYGFYAFAVAAAGLVAVPSQLGIPQLTMREVARSHARSNWEELRGFRRRISQAATVSTLLGAAIIGGALLLFSGGISALEPRSFVAGILFLLPGYVILAIMGSFLTGLRRVLQGLWPTLVLQPGLFALLLLGATFHGRLGPTSAVLLNAMSYAFAIATMGWLLTRYWPREAKDAEPAYRTREWLKSLWPFTLLAGINVINQRTDILVLGIFTSATDVGLYNVANQAALLVSLPLTACNSVLAPNIARLHANGDTERLQRLMTISTLAIGAAAAAGALVLIVAGKWLLAAFFGAGFALGYPALVVLAVGQLINAFAGSVGLFLSMTGNEKDTLKGVSTAAVLNLVLNFVLVPPFGMVGAAVATATSFAVWNVVLAALVRRRLGLVPGLLDVLSLKRKSPRTP